MNHEVLHHIHHLVTYALNQVLANTTYADLAQGANSRVIDTLETILNVVEDETSLPETLELFD